MAWRGSKNNFTKSVSFNLTTDADIVEHLEQLKIPFATYVKQLIRMDVYGSPDGKSLTTRLDDVIELDDDDDKNQNKD